MVSWQEMPAALIGELTSAEPSTYHQVLMPVAEVAPVATIGSNRLEANAVPVATKFTALSSGYRLQSLSSPSYL